MDITPPASDKGVQRLKLENEDTTVKPTAQVAPYPRIESDEEHHHPRPPLTVAFERRQRQRRQQDRASRYDTRTHEERRTHLRRETDHRPQIEGEEMRHDADTTPGVDERA
jgi:hypothetical protein